MSEWHPNVLRLYLSNTEILLREDVEFTSSVLPLLWEKNNEFVRVARENMVRHRVLTGNDLNVSPE